MVTKRGKREAVRKVQGRGGSKRTKTGQQGRKARKERGGVETQWDGKKKGRK